MLLSEARLLFEEGQVINSLKALEEAYSIHPNPKTSKKIERLKEILSTNKKNKSSTMDKTDETAQNASAELVKKARKLFEHGDSRGALDLLLQADTLYPSDKLKRRIERLRKLMVDDNPTVIQ